MRYQLVAAAVFIVSVLFLAAGCGSGSYHEPAPPDSVGWIIVTAYMPYVEDVIIPDPIYAGEDFTVTMRLSSVLEPRLLGGSMPSRLWIEGPGFNPARPQVALFPMWMKDELPPSPAPDRLEYEYPQPCRLPAGEWYIGVQTAKTRELGGVCVEHAPLDYLFSWNENYADAQTGRTNFVEYRLYPITVVQRPGA
jgi:hypothetical protein